jgi:hypothetical protein
MDGRGTNGDKNARTYARTHDGYRSGRTDGRQNKNAALVTAMLEGGGLRAPVWARDGVEKLSPLVAAVRPLMELPNASQALSVLLLLLVVSWFTRKARATNCKVPWSQLL